MPTLYTAEAKVTGGRAGQGRTSDGVVDVKLSTPKEMGGPGTAGATNPEQLFAIGYAACFGGAVEFVARNRKVTLTGPVEVSSKIAFNKDESGFGLGAELAVKVPGVDKATAESLVKEAHTVCPYSKATRNNIDVKLSVV